MVKLDEDVNLEYRMILLSLSESIIPSARISMRSLVIHLHERMYHIVPPIANISILQTAFERAGTVNVYGVVRS